MGNRNYYDLAWPHVFGSRPSDGQRLLPQSNRRIRELILALVLGGMVSLSALLGSLYLGKPILLAGLIGGAVFLIVTMRWPELGILALVGITGGLVDTEWLPYLDLGSVSLHISDVMLFLLLALLLLRATAQPGFRLVGSPLNAPLLLFLSAVLISIGNAVFIFDVDVNNVLRIARKLTYWLAFLPTLQLVRDERSLRRLLAGLWVLAAIFVVGVILPGAFSSLHLLPVSSVQLETAGREFGGVTRVYAVSERLLYVMIPVALASLATIEKGRQVWLLAVLGGLSVWLFRSFQRNYWLTTSLNCSLLFLMLSRQERLRLIRRLLLLFFVGLIILVALHVAQPGLVERQLDSYADRLGSIFNEPTQTDASIRFRLFENQHAIQQFTRHPLLGLGLGNSYRPLMEDDQFGSALLDWYAHNAYLWIATMMGVVGLLPFLWLCVVYVYRSFRYWREIPDGIFRGTYLGLGLAFLGMMVSNLVAPNFVQAWSLTIYPVMMGISERILRIAREKETVTSLNEGSNGLAGLSNPKALIGEKPFV